jgi:hypothetical protein
MANYRALDFTIPNQAGFPALTRVGASSTAHSKSRGPARASHSKDERQRVLTNGPRPSRAGHTSISERPTVSTEAIVGGGSEPPAPRPNAIPPWGEGGR